MSATGRTQATAFRIAACSTAKLTDFHARPGAPYFEALEYPMHLEQHGGCLQPINRNSLWLELGEGSFHRLLESLTGILRPRARVPFSPPSASRCSQHCQHSHQLHLAFDTSLGINGANLGANRRNTDAKDVSAGLR